MTKIIYEIKEHNPETGEEIIRAMTAEEIADIEALQSTHAARIAAEAEKAATKAAVLARLGLTEDELKAVIG
jgi:hypothetical protein